MPLSNLSNLSPHFRFGSRLALALLVTQLIACEPKQEQATASQGHPAADAPFEIGSPGGTRLINVTALPNSFNPYLGSEQSSLGVSNQLFLGLMQIDAQHGQMELALAESIRADAAQKVWTVKLRPNLKWSDGQPLSADDVVFTYNRIIDNPGIANNYRDFWAYQGRFPKVSKKDAKTVTFTLDQPFAPFKHNLAAPILPQHIFAKAVTPTADGRVAFNEMWGINADVKKIVTSGPWQLSSHEPGARLTLIPNPHYYQQDAQGHKLPYLDKLIFSEAAESDVALIRFRRNETDAYLLRPEDYELLAPLAKKENFTIHNLGPTPSQLFVTLNQSTAKQADGKPLIDPVKSAWFRNPAFRQALSHALDKNAIIHSVYKGRAGTQFSHLSAYNPYYDSSLKDYGYNPQKAHKLLYDSGFRQSASGELYDAERNRVSFELTTNTGSPQRDAICALLARDWGKLGIKITYRPRPFNLVSRAIHESHDWEALVFGLAGSPIEPHFSSSRWKLDGRMHLFNMGSGPGWKGKPTRHEPWESEMEKLYTDAAVSTNETSRKALYAKAQQLEHEQLPFLYLVGELNLIAVRNTLGNARPSIYGGSGQQQLNWNAQYHYLKKD